jgi:hypothetical protein
MRRVFLALIIGLGLAAAPLPAAAAISPQPWFGNPDVAIGPQWAGVGDGLSLSFGAKNLGAAAADVTVTIPAYHTLSVSTDGRGCTQAGRSVRCTGPAMADGTFYGQASLHVPLGTPLGYAGQITVSLSSGASTSEQLWIIDAKRGLDLEMWASDAVGRIGDTVTVAVRVTNHGPNPEPYWTIDDVRTPGARLAGFSGCTAVHGGSCEYRRFTAVGQTVTVRMRIKIVGPDSATVSTGLTFGWYLNNTNPGDVHPGFTIYRIGTSSPAPTSGTRSASTTDAGVTSSRLSPSAPAQLLSSTATTAILSTPQSTDPTETTHSPAAVADTLASRGASSTPILAWLGVIALATTAAAFCEIYRRRRRQNSKVDQSA